MIRALHIGDIHLKASHPRGADRLRWFDYLIDRGLDAGVHLWLMSGDVFDAKSNVDDRNQLADRLQRMAEFGPVVWVRGNHDVLGDGDIFARIRANFRVTVVNEPALVHVHGIGDFERVAIAAVPWPSKGGLIAAGTDASETLQASNRALEDILQDLGAQLAEAAEQGYIPIVLGHLNVAGSIASSGQPSIGREIEVAPSMLVQYFNCARYIGVGHIHAPQTLADGRIRYAGSISRNTWGETEAKSAPLITFSGVGPEVVPAPEDVRIELIEIPVPPMYHIDGEFCRGGDGFALSQACSADEDIKRRFLEGDWAGAEVRVRFSFPASERQLVDESLIRASFPGALRLDLEPVAVPDRALRAPEVATAKTLAQKVDAWAHLDGGRSVPASVLQKLAALETGDATQTLSSVANQVAALEQGEKAQVAA